MPLLSPSPSDERRHALVIGTIHYQDGWPDISDGVRGELDRMREILVGTLGYDAATFGEIVDARKGDLAEQIAVWRKGLALRKNDWVLVYYTGHGVEVDGELRLITSDTQVENQDYALAVSDLVRPVFGLEAARHVLMMVDTCYSGAGDLDVVNRAAKIREGHAIRESDFLLVTTASTVQQAQVGAFASAFSSIFVPEKTGAEPEFIELPTALELLKGSLPGQLARTSGTSVGGVRFLPNPNWTPQLRLQVDAATRARMLARVQERALLTHWRPRARGVSRDEDAGWYFTGRSRAMSRLVAWIQAARAKGGGVIVHGGPGSGKSSVLARLATISDARERARAEAEGVLAEIPDDEIPPVDSIDCCVHARDKTAAQIALEIAAAMNLDLGGIKGEPQSVAMDALKTRGGPMLVLVDALDEALEPGSCAAWLRSMRKQVPTAGILIGVRSNGVTDEGLVRELGIAFEQVNLDSPDYYTAADLARYAERYLRHPAANPYAQLPPEVLSRVGSAISEKAGKSFLVAFLTAHTLRNSDRAETDDAALARLPKSVGEALAKDFNRFKGAQGEQLNRVLSALSCALGKGLPAAQWLAIAQGLSSDLIEADIERWRRDAGYYILSDVAFGEPVWRLYHEELSEHLSAQITPPEHEAIAANLEAQVPRAADGVSPDWLQASSYFLSYYSSYLDLAGRGDEMIDIITSASWLTAKRRRNDTVLQSGAEIVAVITFLDNVVPPTSIVKVAQLASAFAVNSTPAPPIVIDVFAALGQVGRAQQMADSIEFPLDRAHAMCCLVRRGHAAGKTEGMIRRLRDAQFSARAVTGHYSTMPLYWIAATAREADAMELFPDLRYSLDRSLDQVHVMVRDGAGTEAGTFAAPHMLFWAAMAARALDDKEMLWRIRTLLAPDQRSPHNNILQTAAVAGDLPYLRSQCDLHDQVLKPRNLALALIEAGLIDEFDSLRKRNAFEPHQYDDGAKRYAWALARRGDFDAALAVATAITRDAEEQARALFHIAEVAAKTGDAVALENVAKTATAMLQLSKLTPARSVESGAQPKGRRPARKRRAPGSVTVEPWRVQSWLAQVMLLAGRRPMALDLANMVAAQGVIPSLATSLAMATPNTADVKGHVDLTTSAYEEEQFLNLARKARTPDEVTEVLRKIGEATMPPRIRALALAHMFDAVASNASGKYAGRPRPTFQGAMFGAAMAGTATLRTVLGLSDQIAGVIEPGITARKLTQVLDALERDLADF